MHALIVISHPKPSSLTHAVAARIAEGVTASAASHSYELADLTAEGFDPTFTAADIAVHLRQGPTPADVAAEQARLDRADALVLAFPVYWWSMPGLLKGWIDRVFTNGWAYDEDASGKVVKRLRSLAVHLTAVGGASLRTYARHGYFGAMRTQIAHGIFNYCGARVVTTELLLPSEGAYSQSHLATAYALGVRLFSSSEAEKTS